MTQRKEWDWPIVPEKRSRRPRIQTVEILPPQQPQQRTVRFERQRNVRIPAWALALIVIGVLVALFPLAFIIAVVMIAIAATVYPTVALITIALLVACVGLIVWDNRRRRRLGY
jgi:hypothetical protein